MLYKEIKFVDEMPDNKFHEFQTFYTAYDNLYEYFYEGQRILQFMVAEHEFHTPLKCECKCCCHCKTEWVTIHNIHCFCFLEDGRVVRAYIHTDRKLDARSLAYEIGINVKWENTRHINYHHIDTVIPRIGSDIIPGGWLARFFSRH